MPQQVIYDGYSCSFVCFNKYAQAIGVMLSKTRLFKMVSKSCFQVTGLADVNQAMGEAYLFFYTCADHQVNYAR